MRLEKPPVTVYTARTDSHGKNRLASNSLLETLVFATRSAIHLISEYTSVTPKVPIIESEKYNNIENNYRKAVLAAIEREKCKNG